MGVDYSANFGIGYKVSLSDEKLEELETCMGGALEDILNGSELLYFETGSSNYGGEDNDFYVVLRDEAIDYKDLAGQLSLMKVYLEQTPLNIESEGGLVGGLLIH